MSVFEIILCLVGIFFVFSSFVMSTKDIKSSFYFKFIPFVCGMYCIFLDCIVAELLELDRLKKISF